MRYYNISGLIISIGGYMDETTLSRMSGYETEPVCTTDTEISVELSDSSIQVPDGSCISVSMNELWQISEGYLTYYMGFPEIEGAAVCAKCSEDFSKIHIRLYDVKKHLGFDDKCYLFNTLSTMMHYIAMSHGRIVFHSSSVCANGCGVAFSADSGVGKSTHTGLWTEHIEGCYYINDDTPIISISDQKVMISGTPFAGTSGINTNVTVPLGAIVFVTRGETNSLVPVDTVTAFSRMMSQLKKPVNDKLADKLISTLGNILKNVSCYLMKCNISPEAAYTAYNTVFCEK